MMLAGLDSSRNIGDFTHYQDSSELSPQSPVKWPSMRRPVGVKSILLSFWCACFFLPAEWPLSPCFHPHSRGAIRFARCMLGVLGSAGAAI